MKTKIIILILALATIFLNAEAYNRVKVKAANYDISDNLDLEAVASLFGDSEDLNDFERRLNDPRNEISNLDLNEDRYIDYLRVVEFANEETRFVTIQAVLGDDIFQDVATIELERDGNNNYSMIIVGNHFIYGADYFIRPVYVYRPTIFDYFFGVHYHPWHSPYYWGYYPTYYTYRAPCHINLYRKHIHHHINRHHHYEYLSHRNHHHSYDYYSNHGRNDYGSRHPEKSFEKRNEGAKNRNDITNNRRTAQPTPSQYNKSVKSKSYDSDVNRRSGASVNRDKSVNRTAPSEKKVTVPSQRRSTGTSRPSTRKVEEKPTVREKSAPAEVKIKSKSSPREGAPKVNKSEQRRSSNNSGSTSKKPESSAKKQASEKKTAAEKKTSEDKGRR
jgi:hypothetical protein